MQGDETKVEGETYSYDGVSATLSPEKVEIVRRVVSPERVTLTMPRETARMLMFLCGKVYTRTGPGRLSSVFRALRYVVFGGDRDQYYRDSEARIQIEHGGISEYGYE
jgi:hypothetical protein